MPRRRPSAIMKTSPMAATARRSMTVNVAAGFTTVSLSASAKPLPVSCVM